MNETIAALVQLQGIDDEISGHREQRDALAENLDRLRSILEQMATELADKRDKLAEASRFYDDKRVDLQADAERMTTAKSKLAGVTRTKEYAAMQRELDTLRKKYSEDEAELRRLQEAIDEYTSAIATKETKLAQLEAEVASEKAASADRLAELDKTIEGIASKKEEVTGKLKRGLVSRYNRILASRQGKAVVPAVEGRCTGCRMMLPPQSFILVQRGETLQSCPSCQRYLYYTAEIAAELAT
ncbi:MAG: hypothetical protein CSA24_02080 [Deltaproteobacteria bacterium]|nr:MAG: hypothetical protein CSA24_02080 [Deltaproteobacteria bacterium]